MDPVAYYVGANQKVYRKEEGTEELGVLMGSDDTLSTLVKQVTSMHTLTLTLTLTRIASKRLFLDLALPY